MNFDYAIHSDFLIHWTGKDIDGGSDSDPKWWELDKSELKDKKSYKCIDEYIGDYINRLSDILHLGLWMTEENEEQISCNGEDEDIIIPSIPKTCFTELKLSESRKHARKYGGLGIGVKRPFLFKRFGRPLIYYGYGRDSTSDIFLKECARDLTDKNFLNFFKPMDSRRKTPSKKYPNNFEYDKPLNYDFYSESEWRILYDKRLEGNLIVDPRKFQNKDEQNYYNKHKDKLEYLIPLDGWLAMIIYPSLDVKNEAHQGDRRKEIRKAIERIKYPEKRPWIEDGNCPIEVTLDDCRNF